MNIYEISRCLQERPQLHLSSGLCGQEKVCWAASQPCKIEPVITCTGTYVDYVIRCYHSSQAFKLESLNYFISETKTFYIRAVKLSYRNVLIFKIQSKMWLRQDQHLLNGLKLSFNQKYGFKQHVYSQSNLRFITKAQTNLHRS